MPSPSASYSVTLRCEIGNEPGMFARLATVVGEAGGDLGAIDIVRVTRATKIRDVTVNARDDQHAQEIVAAVQAVPGVKVVQVSDRTFLMHLGGKLEIQSKVPLKTRDDLSMAYTPGVARVCRAIARTPDDVYNLTSKRNMVAVVTDGTAVLGLGDIGPAAALPVMEGKAILFKEFADVDAFPLCLDTRDVDAIVETVIRVAPGFGGINLEDIAAPRCFEVEERLQAALDIPVFHDDQHGTAVVVLAALINALRIVGKEFSAIRVVVNGLGAAGVAITKMLLAVGVQDIVGCDRWGALYPGAPFADTPTWRWYAEHTNPHRLQGDLRAVLGGADVFIGVSAPNLLARQDLVTMAADPIVFALANPDPEVPYEEAEGVARTIATGRSDYPNQVNNVLAFPGIFRGALDCRASRVTEGMKVAAAQAIAGMVSAEELAEDYIIPSVFNRGVAPRVAAAVAAAARRDGVARR
ncbi:MAG TPA: malic enzyme-like NAD(P)-binding protein [Chloroflexota bacterium]|jgi:malate dehydrogenase (oxaloacetate-decarboxylating)|nr:malic enzyme-like NAD(P)-binding protein [Chloroflexota bacterium]